MARRALDPKMRSLVLQSLLVGVFAASVGLAAVVTKWVRMSLRVELDEQKTFGRLVVRLPAEWLSSTATVERGEGVEAEEPPSEQQAGRRLKILRQRADGLIPPLDHLIRGGLIKPEVLKSLADGRDGFSLTNVAVAGWPGQMLTAVSSPRPGVIHKDVIACGMLPGGQAVVVRLEGLGPVDASDRELVRQMCENVSLAAIAPAAGSATAPREGRALALVDGIKVDAPPSYLRVDDDNDPNDQQERLVYDGVSAGGSAWVAIELASCVFFADDRDDTFLAMLAARDPDWRSTAVRRPTPNTLVADRTDAAGQAFPSRACLTVHGDGRALLVVMRGGGPRDARLFDAAWDALARSARFEGSKDLSALIVNGADAARTLSARTLFGRVDVRGVQDWLVWDASENAGSELWSQLTWQLNGDGVDPEMFGPPVASAVSAPDGITGARVSRPANAHAADTEFEQQWSASVDVTRYQATTYRAVRRGGGTRMPRQTLEQRFTLDRGRMTLTPGVGGGPGFTDAPAPTTFVPGAIVPFVVRQLAVKPSLIRTESFVGAETVVPGGLLTLIVARPDDAPARLDERGGVMECVTVGVNGTGQVSRWYFAPDKALRYIDFAGGLKAQTGTK